MKIILLTSNIDLPRIQNRIAEFRKYGYELDVFYYCRETGRPFRREDGVSYHLLGEVGRGASSYFKRLLTEYGDVRKVVKDMAGQDVVFYFITNDLALLYYLMRGKQRYIYEEADIRHTYFSSGLLRRLFEFLDKKIISKSLLSVLVSKGFAAYHYGDGKIPDNVTFIFNKLNPSVQALPYTRMRVTDIGHLRVGFVGSIRFESVYNFARVMCSSFPFHEFHFYGNVVDDIFNNLKSYSNCFFHGPFSNPSDLPGIYSDIDLVLSTYDTRFENVRFAEPNKIYESMYFEVPIIVSKGTYLEEKVTDLGIGYSVNAMNDAEVVSFISSLTIDSLSQKSEKAHRIPKKECVVENECFFKLLEDRLKHKN